MPELLDLKEIVVESITRRSPLKLQTLTYEVKRQTGFRKDLNYDYYVQKYLDLLVLEHKVQVKGDWIEVRSC